MTGPQFSAEWFTSLFEPSVVGILVADSERRAVSCNRRMAEFLGYDSPGEVVGIDPTMLTPPDDVDSTRPLIGQLVDGTIARYTAERRWLRKDGSTVWLRVSMAPLPGTGLYFGVFEDLSEQRLAQLQLGESRALLDRVQEVVGVGTWVWDARRNTGEWSEQARSIYGLSLEAAAAGDMAAWWRVIHPDDVELVESGPELSQVGPYELEHRLLRPDGEVRWVRSRATTERDPEGRTVRHVGVVIDITEHRLVQKELRETATLLERAQDVGEVGSWIWYPHEKREIWSERAQRIYGFTPEEAATEDPALWQSILHPDDREWVIADADREFAEAVPAQVEYRIVRKSDGEIRHVRDRSRTELGPDGKPWRMLGALVDITAEKQSEVERVELEGRLRQSQKLEAVGQLAGGVAHDFNNLLTVIMGHAALALTVDHGAARSDIEEIMAAGERAAGLVRQLLTFSRREPLAPRLVDLNEIVSGSRLMLNRLIEASVVIGDTLHEAPVPVAADRGQIEQVILNLALNARDAMPSGGHLTLRTDVFRDGSEPLAVLAVEDTGEGMDAQTAVRIFEPFFTTKEPGRGTGLGLSTVYGIVRGAGGDIDVRSEPGVGTTFTVTFPLAVTDSSG
jgi:PAS domain S-box-containing protein